MLQLLAAVHALLWGRYNVVHVHGSENGFVVPLLRLRYPVVSTNHGPAYEREKWSVPARRLIRGMERLSVVPVDEATAVAANQAEALTRRYGRWVRHIPNGIACGERVDESGAEALLTGLGLESGGYVLFAAARVDPTKGCHTLIEALHALASPPPTLVVGDLGHAPGYGDSLRARAHGLPLHFVPRLEDKATVLGLLKRCRAFVFPSTVEAMSMMLLESLSVGAVGVASDIAENAMILPPGYPLFRAGDAGALAASLSDVLSWSVRERTAHGDAARRWALGLYDWDVIAKSYLRAYERACAR
jgi:glycosyltransferase involved in cell wall biosynthesis